MNTIATWLLAQSDIPMPDSAVEHQGSFWFPEEASDFAGEIDFIYLAITWVSTIFFAIIVGVMIWFVIRYRRREGVGPEPSHSHNTALEIFWSVIPSILLVWFFYIGARGYFDMKVPTDDVEEIYVTASQFNWKFVYPDGDISKELHVVLDRPTKLIMRSEDVVHSMYIPAFRQKQDVVPGRYTYAYFTPTKVGQYRLACAEYCGEGHSRMRTVCQVHITPSDRKLNTQWEPEKHHGWVNGERLFQINCSGCHSITGEVKTGPALNTIWGAEERLQGGGTVPVDENYVRESILDPNRKIVEGFGPVSKMNSFAGKLSDDEIHYLIEYIHYLKEPEKFPARDEPVQAESEDGEPSSADAATEGEAMEDAATEGEATEDEATEDEATKNSGNDDAGAGTDAGDEVGGEGAGDGDGSRESRDDHPQQ